MAAIGFSLNNLTLFGLVLAIGIVVDDAIVVVEAVEHHIEEGMSPHDATIQAMREVSGPVIAVALVLTAVFMPCTFISGHHRLVFQAIRGDRFGVDRDLGLQFADAQPSVGRDLAEADAGSKKDIPDAGAGFYARLVLPAVQLRLSPGPPTDIFASWESCCAAA